MSELLENAKALYKKKYGEDLGVYFPFCYKTKKGDYVKLEENGDFMRIGESHGMRSLLFGNNKKQEEYYGPDHSVFVMDKTEDEVTEAVVLETMMMISVNIKITLEEFNVAIDAYQHELNDFVNGLNDKLFEKGVYEEFVKNEFKGSEIIYEDQKGDIDNNDTDDLPF